MKYSPSGGEISVRARVEGTEVHTTVTDRGIGIAADELENVFNLFYRSPDPRAGHVGGLGLGLYISREIVTRHGGRMWAESTGDGSIFHVVLPLSSASPNAPEAASAPKVTVPGVVKRG